MEISDILVPVDFSNSSLKPLEYALSMVSAEGEVCLLHVIDSDFLDKIEENELSSKDVVQEKLRQRAESALDKIIESHSNGEKKLTKMVVVGVPFVEILRITKDLDFSLIAMGIRGKPNVIKELFFGSTVDKVLRATRVPVVCVPL